MCTVSDPDQDRIFEHSPFPWPPPESWLAPQCFFAPPSGWQLVSGWNFSACCQPAAAAVPSEPGVATVHSGQYDLLYRVTAAACTFEL